MSDFLNRLSEVSWDEVAAAINSFLADPLGDVEAMMVGAVAIVLVLLIAVLLALYLLMPPKRRLVRTRRYLRAAEPESTASGAPESGSDDEPIAEAPRGKPSKPAGPVITFLGSGLGLLLIVLTSCALLYAATSTDSYCTEVCHSGSSSVLAARKADHASCVGCHERSGLVGVGGNTFARLRMVIHRLTGQTAAEARPVPSSQCVRCHKDVLEETVQTARGMAVAHEEILGSGEPCTTCHGNAGHTPATYTLGMAPCVVCHDSVTASVECETCHLPQVAQRPDAGASADEISPNGYHYTRIDASKPYCHDCHDVANQCDPCHGGIRMPHDDGFILGGHARPAAFAGKQVCWKCHDFQTDCNSPCHAGFNPTGMSGHPEGWRSEHAKAPSTSTCGCHQWRSGRTGPMCPVCH